MLKTVVTVVLAFGAAHVIPKLVRMRINLSKQNKIVKELHEITITDDLSPAEVKEKMLACNGHGGNMYITCYTCEGYGIVAVREGIPNGRVDILSPSSRLSISSR